MAVAQCNTRSPGLILAALLSGCVPMVPMVPASSARTLDAGSHEISLGIGAHYLRNLVYTPLSGQIAVISSPVHDTAVLPQVDVGGRLGLTDSLEVGAHLVGVDGRLAFLRGDEEAGAVNASIAARASIGLDPAACGRVLSLALAPLLVLDAPLAAGYHVTDGSEALLWLWPRLQRSRRTGVQAGAGLGFRWSTGIGSMSAGAAIVFPIHPLDSPVPPGQGEFDSTRAVWVHGSLTVVIHSRPKWADTPE
jgi:hypothetical protein